jgi:DNA-binding transcriptional ArsR family regulator
MTVDHTYDDVGPQAREGGVVRFELSAEDLRNTRLSFSPLWEAVLSYRLLLGAASHPLQTGWADWARRAVGPLDLRTLGALLATGMAFDFMLPLPEEPGAPIGDELDRMREGSTDDVAAEIELAHATLGRTPPVALQPFVDHSQLALHRLAGELKRYWDAALAPHWPAMRAVLEGELLHGAHRHVSGGVDALLTGLHPAVRWDGSTLEVAGSTVRALRPGGRGVVFMATAFAWPEATAGISTDGTPLVAYQARGTAALWGRVRDEATTGLGVLLGPERAAVLENVRVPRSTTDLARMLRTGASNASYHLAVLRQAGLVESHRYGRRVLYRLSPLGAGLLRLWDEADQQTTPARRRRWTRPPAGPGELSKSIESFPLPRPPA